jgi:hypothetical protein
MATSRRYLAGAQMLTGSHGEAASLAPCAGAGAISYAEIGRHDVKGPSGEGWHSAPARNPSTRHRVATPRTHELNAPVDAVNNSRRIRRSCHAFSRRFRHHERRTFRCSEAISEGQREGFRIPLAPLRLAQFRGLIRLSRRGGLSPLGAHRVHTSASRSRVLRRLQRRRRRFHRRVQIRSHAVQIVIEQVRVDV